MNLTQVAKLTRGAVAGTIVALIVYFIGYFSFPFIKQGFQALFPTKEKPVIAFGQLPKITMENVKVNASQAEYSVSTKDGRIPNITPQLVNIYKVTKPRSSFSAGKIAQRKAVVLGFQEADLTSGLSESVFKWRDNAFFRDLQINISTNTLVYDTDLLALGEAKFVKGPQLVDKANTEAPRAILSTVGYLTDPLYNTEGVTRTTFGKFQGDRLVETTAAQEYTFAKVDFFRSIFKKPIVGPNFDEGMLQVTYAIPTLREDSALKYLKIRAYEWGINTKEFGKYPALPVGEAWKKVTAGEGFFARAKLRNASSFETQNTVNPSKIFVESVTIGYLDSYSYQEYLQPIYIFGGTFLTSDNQQGTIIIYYPAVDPKYIKS